MSTMVIDEVAEILEKVSRWPTEVRIDLAQKILGTIVKEFPMASREDKPTESLLGILKLDGPPPTDEDCQRILEDELIRKYVR